MVRKDGRLEEEEEPPEAAVVGVSICAVIGLEGVLARFPSWWCTDKDEVSTTR